MLWLIFALIAFKIATAALGFSWFKYWRQHAGKYEESGYTPPASSWGAEVLFYLFARALVFVTVGRVDLIHGRLLRGQAGTYEFEQDLQGGIGDLPGRTVFLSNHQMQPDFAMLRHGAGRHFRMLTSADELKDLPEKAGYLPCLLRKIFAVGSAASGVISVGFKNKDDGQKAQSACIAALASNYTRLSRPQLVLLLVFWLLLALTAILSGHAYLAVGALVLSGLVGCLPGSQPALGIFPEGSLFPDNPELSEHFRPGAFRIAKAVAERSGEPVQIVPMAIYYKRDEKDAGWSQRFFAKLRSNYRGKRHPRCYPEFKLDADKLPEHEREQVLARREQLMDEYRNSTMQLYGAVVVRGDPVLINELPDDPIAAMQDLRDRVAALYQVAKSHTALSSMAKGQTEETAH